MCVIQLDMMKEVSLPWRSRVPFLTAKVLAPYIGSSGIRICPYKVMMPLC